jgi:hypothetical protein
VAICFTYMFYANYIFFVVICPLFGILHQENSGNPDSEVSSENFCWIHFFVEVNTECPPHSEVRARRQIMLRAVRDILTIFDLYV